MADGNLIEQVVAWLERQKALGRRRVPLSAATRALLRGGPPPTLLPAGGAAPPVVSAPPASSAPLAPPATPAPPAASVTPAVSATPAAPATPAPRPVPFHAPPPPDLAGTGWEALREQVAGCTRCPLHGLGRRQAVFGEGDPQARLMFIGEGPGVEEDEQGRLLVGPAGQLLAKMIEAMKLRREEVYIANVVKCRPPPDRAPEDGEGAACLPYLLRQIELVKPACIVLLGAVPYLQLLGKKGITRGRGQWEEFRGIPVMPTYHPAFLLRVGARKREAWADLQAVMARLGAAAK